jgi:hypothetical protein
VAGPGALFERGRRDGHHEGETPRLSNPYTKPTLTHTNASAPPQQAIEQRKVIVTYLGVGGHHLKGQVYVGDCRRASFRELVARHDKPSITVARSRLQALADADNLHRTLAAMAEPSQDPGTLMRNHSGMDEAVGLGWAVALGELEVKAGQLLSKKNAPISNRLVHAFTAQQIENPWRQLGGGRGISLERDFPPLRRAHSAFIQAGCYFGKKDNPCKTPRECGWVVYAYLHHHPGPAAPPVLRATSSAASTSSSVSSASGSAATVATPPSPSLSVSSSRSRGHAKAAKPPVDGKPLEKHDQI